MAEFLGSPAGYEGRTAFSTMEKAVPSPGGSKGSHTAPTGQTRSLHVARLPQRDGAGVWRTHNLHTEVSGDGTYGGAARGQGATAAHAGTNRGAGAARTAGEEAEWI
jgi:hypothetical protein